MARLHVIPLLLAGGALIFQVAAACPFVEARGAAAPSVASMLNAAGRIASLDESCLAVLVDRMKDKSDPRQIDHLVRFLDDWTKPNGFSLSLLFRCAELQTARGDERSGKLIVALWEKRNRPFAAAISERTSSGSQESADSLFVAFDRCITLGVDALLWWARSMEVRHLYSGSVALHCRAMGAEPRLRSMALHQFSQLLENAPHDSVRPALAGLERCIFSLPAVDTLRMQQWIADAYARHGCATEELAILERFSPIAQMFIPRLLDIAGMQVRNAGYGLAVRAAYLCVTHAREPQRVQAAAMILSKAYDATGKGDSALYWLKRGDLSSEQGKIAAASLYQRRGRPADAQQVIDALKPSVARDTLEIRQRIFTGDLTGAGELAAAGTFRRAGNGSDAHLWKVRTLVFLERFDDLAPFLDSLAIDPAWSSSRELVGYRYWLSLFSRDREALATWAGVEYRLFTGTNHQAAMLVKSRPLPDELRVALLLRIVRQCRIQGDFALIVKVIGELAVRSGSPECIFLYAEALAETGNVPAAKTLLLSLLQDFPADVYAQKARILLEKIERKS